MGHLNTLLENKVHSLQRLQINLMKQPKMGVDCISVEQIIQINTRFSYVLIMKMNMIKMK